MNPCAAILIYGRDLSLLETRGWVLERAGYASFLALKLEEVEQIAASQPIALLLLCHTLSPEDEVDAMQAVGKIRPGIRNLLVTANTFVAVSARGERTVSAFDGPRAMIAAVAGALVTEDGRR